MAYCEYAFLTAAPLTQKDERRSAVREVVTGSNPGRANNQGPLNKNL